MSWSSLIRPSTRLLKCARLIVTNVVSKNTLEQSEPGGLLQLASPKSSQLGRLLREDRPINKILQKNEKIQDSEWSVIREDLLDNSACTEVNVDSKICDMCLHYYKLDEAMSYLKYLKRSNYELNLHIKGLYLRLLYTQQKPLTAEVEEEILGIYDGIRKQYPVLDSKTASDCVLGLSLTKRWRDAFELLDIIKLSSSVGPSTSGPLLCAALRDNEEKMFWNLLNDREKDTVYPKVYSAYLDYCQRNFQGDRLLKEVEKMFYFWQENDVEPPEYIIEQYVNLYKSFGYPVSYTRITQCDSRGFCSCCNYELQPTTLSAADFKLLSVAALKLIIVGKNVYTGTTPDELHRYKNFIKNIKPYDVVIDGLNVAYVGKEKNRASLNNILVVMNRIQRKRILVIGRQHMRKWSSDIMDRIEQQADVFLVKNLSQDDPFLLHLTLTCGPDTYFVSNDLMRSHKAKLLDPALKKLFKRWQLSRQYYFKKDARTFQLKLHAPLQFQIGSQNDENGWHIPYSKSAHVLLPDKYECSDHWVCLKTNKKPNQ